MRHTLLLAIVFSLASAAQEAPGLEAQIDKLSYALGMDLGAQLRKSSVNVDPAVFARGLSDALTNGRLLLTEQQAKAAIEELQAVLKKKEYSNRRKSPQESETELKLLAEYNKSAGSKFLAENKNRPGVVALPSGVQYKVIKGGNGPRPKAEDTIECNYRVALLNGTEFFNTFKSQQPATMKVSGVLKGLNEVLQLMPVGSRWDIVIPPGLAYGENGPLPIGPNATINYEVEVLAIQ
jgi:FKBP-type peptidyl-prolyl cis-trans isomerase FklB